jgi:2-keto-4-pentenoate hydratase/2-oxohepta-3-ene-1,7-dioic acid hydratase in catechol pathway
MPVRIARFVAPSGGLSWGVVEGDDVAAIDGHPFAKITFGGARWPVADIRLLSPVLPSKVVAVGRNYADHAAEMGNEVPKTPLLFLKPSTSVIGTGDVIRLPASSHQVEHEAELAVVIGVPAKDVEPAQAMDHVLGYTAANDVTARDQQRADGQFTRAKGYDSFCPLGPWIETVLDPSDLRITAAVNGETRQDGRTSQLVHGIPELIAFASQVMTLLPGDVILTGTPAGVGPLQDGDSVSVEIEGIGTLTNAVRAR